jgi:hypothetical protein
VPNDFELFAWLGRNEDTGDLVELGVADAVAFPSLARVHPRAARLFRHVEEMELAGWVDGGVTTVKADKSFDRRDGAPIRVDFADTSVHVFDKDSGDRIR